MNIVNNPPDSSEVPPLEWSELLKGATHFNRRVAMFALESNVELLPFHGYAIAHFQGDSENVDGAIQTFLDSADRELAAMDFGEMIIILKDIVLQSAPQMALMYPNYEQIADQ